MRLNYPTLYQEECFQLQGEDFWAVAHRLPGYVWYLSLWVAIPTGSQKAVSLRVNGWNGSGDDYQGIFKTLGGTASTTEIGDIKCFKDDYFTFFSAILLCFH